MTFGTLALLIVAGLAGPLLALPAPTLVPVVVGEIAAGVVLGVSGFDVIDASEPTTAFLGRVGFALLMFVAGTQVPVRKAALRPALRRALAAALLTAAAAVAVAAGLSAPLGIPVAVLALPLAASSAAIVLPLLHERGAAGDAALFALAWVTVADVATIVALPLGLARHDVARIALGSIAVAAIAACLLLGARSLDGNDAVRRVRKLSRRLEWALDLRLSLLAIAVLAYVADRVNTSILIAGFATGLLVSAIGQPRRLTRQVRGLAQGFFIPLFFVTLGARLDVRGLDVGVAVALIVAATVIHLLVAIVLRQPPAAGLAATATLGVPAAVVELGLANGLINPGQGAAIVAAALVSIGIGAAGVRLLPAAPEDAAPSGTRDPAPSGSSPGDQGRA
jgi:Kef-type K+ transport system membrane component KefB